MKSNNTNHLTLDNDDGNCDDERNLPIPRMICRCGLLTHKKNKNVICVFLSKLVNKLNNRFLKK